MEKRIVLGSGKLYVLPYNNLEIPANEEIEQDENLLGLIKGGATLSYAPTFYTAKDDLGIVQKKMLTEETATLKSGIMTWNAATLDKICTTAHLEDDGADSGKRVLKIGGIGNYDNGKFVIRFVHHDASDGDIRITLVGSNEAGFEIAFAPDTETVVDAEFSAFPCDDMGTLIIYEEDVASGNASGLVEGSKAWFMAQAEEFDLFDYGVEPTQLTCGPLSSDLFYDGKIYACRSDRNAEPMEQLWLRLKDGVQFNVAGPNTNEQWDELTWEEFFAASIFAA